MEISPEKYAHHFPPAADYLLLQKIPLMDDRIGGIIKPDSVVKGQAIFTHIAKILAISEFPSQEEYLNEFKALLTHHKCKYVCFPGHVVGEIVLPEQFRFPKEVDGLIISVHLKDVFQIPFEYDELILEWNAFQAVQEEASKVNEGIISEERSKLLRDKYGE